eukprot:Blabericola_migrator_1__13547@NODE_992_length_5778_cov_12_714411_g669_i1_p3_GENE_NODE_992_length_5778_cov_12_714411_g669_i1NODE_992_length_5778_cov_12_714411_g669_i1_p3_ORF_typecomplete_len161_score24_74RVP/PF00077_20/5e08gagasp_proteas/PF13975_6/2_1e07RVP_2/PF08284_11/3_4e06Asp_protease/PF09668_10/1_4e05Asp_protease_2/PF13650_6/3_2e05Peptidase_A2B/PF12384_8/0_02_NODE_992_length_5778_cov_12_714411_g669_i141354617
MEEQAEAAQPVGHIMTAQPRDLSLYGSVRDVDLDFILDTGSPVSLLKEVDFMRLPLTEQAKLRDTPHRQMMGAFGGHRSAPLGQLESDIFFEKQEWPVTFVVMPGLNRNILGLDWMTSHQVRLNPAERQIVIGENEELICAVETQNRPLEQVQESFDLED